MIQCGLDAFLVSFIRLFNGEFVFDFRWNRSAFERGFVHFILFTLFDIGFLSIWTRSLGWIGESKITRGTREDTESGGRFKQFVGVDLISLDLFHFAVFVFLISFFFSVFGIFCKLMVTHFYNHFMIWVIVFV